MFTKAYRNANKFVTSNQELYTHALHLLGHMTDDGWWDFLTFMYSQGLVKQK